MSYPKTETIKCPECGEVQDAEVTYEDYMPFPTYVHECECGYIIMESDWEKVERWEG